jgi:pimeloyl-ACP methyl ester carboxylesterase
MSGDSPTGPLPTLFLSGSGLPAWVWEEVRATLPGETRVAPSPADGASLAEHAQATLEHASDWPRFNVVAHSIGGVVAAAVAARAPERVAGLVAVAASVPAAGSSFVGALPFPQRHVMSLMVRLLGTRPPAKVIRAGLCAGLDPAQANRIVAEFTPAPKTLFLDPVPAHVLPRASTYVLTTKDTELPPGLQAKYAAQLGGDVVRLETGHLPMLEAPAPLSRILRGRLTDVPA